MISYETAIKILSDSGCAQNVIEHCEAVSLLSVSTAQKLLASGIIVDVELVRIGSVLHDIGRARTHAVDHAAVGAVMAQELDLDDRIVNIIKCHIGGGISRVEARELGLPDDDYIPTTIEERIVAHCDNLMRGIERITVDECILRMQSRNMGQESIDRVRVLADEIGVF